MRPLTIVALGALGLVPLACKDGNASGTSSLGPGGTGVPAEPVEPSFAGDGGCNGPDQDFAGCEEVDLTAVLAALSPAVGSLTRVTAAQSSPDLLYATAVHSTSGDSTVLSIDLADVANPVVEDLLPAGSLDALVASILGAPGQGVLGELAVLDGSTLVAVELATNTLVAVGRTTPGSLQRFAGEGMPGGGFFDGDARSAMFSFDAESQLCATGDGRLFVADTGNHALRVIFGNPLFEPSAFVRTLAGGAAGFADGPLDAALFDSPTGVAVSCDDRLFVTERGDLGEGHRIRQVALFGFDFFTGAILGDVFTIAGDGTSATVEGDGVQARVAEPTAPQISAEGEAYWIDAATGSLRRLDGLRVDCALAPCGTPSMLCSGGADFTPGASFSTAVTSAGDLVVLESGTTLLRRF